jgi:Flp pilus assembly protein TadG
VWLLLAIPAFLVMLCTAAEIGNLWLARTELETALEASALAAAGQWRLSGDTAQARDFAVAYAAGNTVVGDSLTLARNDGGSGLNENASCSGDIVLGAITGATCSSLVFDANSHPVPGTSGYGVRAQKVWEVTPLCRSMFAVPLSTFTVSAEATAMCSGSSQLPRLVRVQQVLCDED